MEGCLLGHPEIRFHMHRAEVCYGWAPQKAFSINGYRFVEATPEEYIYKVVEDTSFYSDPPMTPLEILLFLKELEKKP